MEGYRKVFLTLLVYCLHRISNTETLTTNDISTDLNRSPLTKIGEKYYWIEATKDLNWFEAVHFCRTRGTYLASIESEDEMIELSAYLVSKGWSNWFWTSGNDLIAEGDWNWLSTGKKIIYANWDDGQPSNAFAGEHCLNLWRNGDLFKWNDNTCHNTCNYICESRSPKLFQFSD